jgi:hypothetical protein
MRIHALLCLALLLAGAVLCTAQEPGQMVFTAGRLAEQLGVKQGELVEDDAADAGRAFRVKASVNLEQYGDLGVLKPGTFRFMLRAKMVEAPPAGASLEMACWNPHGTVTSFRNTATITADDFRETGKYVDISRDFRVGLKGVQYGIYLRGGWPGLLIESFSITAITPPAVEITRVWPEKLLYRLDETGKLLVSLRNNTDVPQTVRLVVTVESGLAQSVGLYSQDVTVAVPTAEQRQKLTDVQPVFIPLPPQSEYGHKVTARLYPAGDKPQPPLGPEVAEYFYSSNRPLQIGQYGGVGISEAYTAKETSRATDHRRAYFPILEFMFWAPCDLSLLTPLPGKDRWWSGQTLKQLSTAQMKAYIDAAHANGMACVAYVDFNIIYSYRIVDVFRQYPDSVGWDTNSMLLAYEVKNIARQKRENDEERKGMEARGIYGPIASHPKLLKLHGDQLEAGMRAFDWDGYRWDDPTDYDRPMVDLFGRQAPYQGYTNAAMIEYLRKRTRAAKPDAMFGHNMDWNLEAQPDPLKNVPPYYTEFLRDGSFALQEAGTNFAMANRWPWKKWAEENARAGRNAYRYGGEQYVIIGRNNSALEMNYLISLLTAGGGHIAYGVPDSCIPYMRLICRYSDLFYGDNRHYPDPDATLKVDDGGKLWWKNYLRYRALAPGKRVYYVHLFNPPTTEKMGDDKAQPPAPLANVALTWTLPAGWKATAAYHLTADAPGAVEAVVNPTPVCTYTTLTTGRALERQPLPLAGTRVTVPAVKQWSIVAVECSGPADAPEPTERLALPPVPPLPDLNAPVVGEKAAPKPMGAFRDRQYTSARFAGNAKLATAIDDPQAAGGKAARITARGNVEFYEFPEGTMPAGMYRFAVRLRAEKALPENTKLLVSAWSPNGTPKAFRVSAPLDLSALTPAQGYQEIACDLELGDARVQTGVQIANLCEGLVLDTFTIVQTQLYPDSKRLAWEPGVTWPDQPPTPKRPENAAGPRVWYGNGLFAEHYHLDEALGLMLGATLDHADHVVWRDRRGWDGTPFPKTPEELMGYDLVVLANVDLKTLTMLQREWLRGYVRDGGKLLLLGGPYGFGRGYWQDSDILADVIPATMEPYDLRVVGEKTPAPLTPVSAWAKSAAPWKAVKPATVWMHAVKPKAGATVHLTAAGLPALITAPCGLGKVALVTITPLGDAPKGTTPFWTSQEWLALMGSLGGFLLK